RKEKYLAAGKQFLEKKDYSRAILQFRNAAQAVPNDPEVYYQLGMAYGLTKDFRMAVSAFRKALAIYPKHVGSQVRMAEMMSATDDEGLLKDAQKSLKAMLEGTSPTPEMINTLALTELKLGNTEGGVRSLEQSLAQAPGELTASLLLARTKMSQKD